jgi:penicillin-binding protein 1C
MVDDKPLVEPVGTGLHTYRNYSRTHYGLLPVRDVLGNSLNIPAIKTIQFTGKPDFLRFLHTAGFESLTKPAEFYGEGLALGNGEVSLFELVQGYNALASRGVWRPLRVMYGDQQNAGSRTSRRLVSSEISSIISDILSDPQARRLEFGRDGALRLPVETAVKTGTSTDFRDAWAIGYSRNFTVGVWMGNLNRVSMFEVSGARGPALVLRSIFSKLEKLRESKDLYRSPTLTRLSICPLSGLLAARDCPQVQELFIAGTAPRDTCVKPHATDLHDPATAPSATTPSATAPSTTAPHWARVALPSPGLRIARDPRIPDTSEAFAFELETSAQPLSVTWILNDIEVARRIGGQLRYLWQLKAGQHLLKAKVRFNAVDPEVETAPVEFFVR